MTQEAATEDGGQGQNPPAAGEQAEPYVRGKVLRTPSGGIAAD